MRRRSRNFGDDKFEAMMWRLEQQLGYRELVAAKSQMRLQFLERAYNLGEELWRKRDALERLTWQYRLARTLDRSLKRHGWMLFPPFAWFVCFVVGVIWAPLGIIGIVLWLLGLLSYPAANKLRYFASRSVSSQLATDRAAWEEANTAGQVEYEKWWESACENFRGYPPDWPQRRRAVLARDAHRCRRCSRAGSLHVHHQVALSEGGTNALQNLIAICRRCHSDEHS